MLPNSARDDLMRRLRKIEGQTQGIQRMLADGRDCREILNQLASVKAATQSVSMVLMKHYALSSLQSPDSCDSEKTVTDLISMMLHVTD